MGEFFSNVSRYPKYLITIILGVFYASLQPLLRMGKNPITAIAVIGAKFGGCGINLIIAAKIINKIIISSLFEILL